MAIVRHEGQLTLINSVRMDDQFYVARYNTTFHAFADGTTYTEPTLTHHLVDGGKLPFPNARLFAFDHVHETEGAILLEHGPGILLTADAVQSYSTPPHMPYTNWLVQKLLALRGFTRDTIIGPVWLELAVTDKSGIKNEFERLLAWDFDQLLSAHGVFVEQNAHAELATAFAKTFG